MAYGLLRLAALTGEHAYEERAAGVLRLLHHLAAQHPQAFAHLLQALDFHLSPTREVALAGPDTDALVRVVRGEFRPHIVLAGGEPDGVPLLEGRGAGRRTGRRLRVRGVRVQGARDRAGRAGRAARLTFHRTSTSGGQVRIGSCDAWT